MITGEKNTDLKTDRATKTEIGRLHWNQGEEVAHFAWFGEPWTQLTFYHETEMTHCMIIYIYVVTEHLSIAKGVLLLRLTSVCPYKFFTTSYLPHAPLPFTKTNVLHYDLKKNAINEFGIKYWTSNPVWVTFQAPFMWILKKKYDYTGEKNI
jgi:hypothetical protein